MKIRQPPASRGTFSNPAGRFERLTFEPEPGFFPAPETEYFRDRSRTVLTHNDSPDVPFETGLNPYRGCEHGCIYCYARPTHEYLGFSAGIDFERRIMVKEDAPELLRRELSAPGWQPRTIALSGVTDPYQPIERRSRITRRCLEVLAEFRNPVGIVTKSRLVTRDLDVLLELGRFDAVSVSMSITTLDHRLQRRLEPRASSPSRRLTAIQMLNEAGIPVGVNVAPVIPGLTDHEIPSILDAAQRAGARAAGFQLLRLPGRVAELFVDWLNRNYPERGAKVLGLIRESRGGRLTDSRFHLRFRGEGEYTEQILRLFKVTRRKLGLEDRFPPLSIGSFRRPSCQMTLFRD